MKYLVVVLSGGMDSATLLHKVFSEVATTRENFCVKTLSFDYGQRHRRELECARTQAMSVGASHQIIEVPSLRGAPSVLTREGAVPEGHYADANMKKTVVPGRNTIFLATALGFTQSLLSDDDDIADVHFGAHAGDHAIYPDCRPAYVLAMQLVFLRASEGRVSLYAPFSKMHKGEIAKEGLRLGVDYLYTHTCYSGTDPACGRCSSCVERLEAFAFAGVEDPIAYVDREYWKTVSEKSA